VRVIEGRDRAVAAVAEKTADRAGLVIVVDGEPRLSSADRAGIVLPSTELGEVRAVARLRPRLSDAIRMETGGSDFVKASSLALALGLAP